MKRLEKRMNDVEQWMKNFEKGSGPAQTMDNMNFLVGQTRLLGEQMQQLQKQNMEMNQILQDNHNMLQEYLEKEDMVLSWQSFLENKNKERENALQEQEAESVSAREETQDSEEMGEEVPDQAAKEERVTISGEKYKKVGARLEHLGN